MRLSKLAGWVCFVALMSTGTSGAATIVTNGDFETGSLSGWKVDAGSDTTHPPIVIGYNNTSGFPNGAYGESVPTPINGLTSGAYFSADTAPQSISQTVALIASTSYLLSFDIYAPQNGRNNPFDASLVATLNGTAISNAFSADSLTNGWVYYSTIFVPTAASFYDLALNFKGNGDTAADFVVDNVSIQDNVSLTTAIPETSTWAMLILGFASLGFAGYRQKAIHTLR
jgi:hypothetical protein